MKLGSQMYGNGLGSKLAGPSTNLRKGTGVDSTAMATMLASKARPRTFHASTMLRGTCLLPSSKIPRIRPEIPLITSKLQPGDHSTEGDARCEPCAKG